MFLGWLKDTIGQLRVAGEGRATIDALAALPGVLATLNYDSLLEDATHRIAVTWQQPDKVQDVAHAQDDEDASARRSAVKALASGWKNDPDTLRILKARAQDDKDAGVRRIAVRALARCWKNDPDTLRILKVRAQDDEDAGVRRSAAHGNGDHLDRSVV